MELDGVLAPTGARFRALICVTLGRRCSGAEQDVHVRQSQQTRWRPVTMIRLRSRRWLGWVLQRVGASVHLGFLVRAIAWPAHAQSSLDLDVGRTCASIPSRNPSPKIRTKNRFKLDPRRCVPSCRELFKFGNKLDRLAGFQFQRAPINACRSFGFSKVAMLG